MADWVNRTLGRRCAKHRWRPCYTSQLSKYSSSCVASFWLRFKNSQRVAESNVALKIVPVPCYTVFDFSRKKSLLQVVLCNTAFKDTRLRSKIIVSLRGDFSLQGVLYFLKARYLSDGWMGFHYETQIVLGTVSNALLNLQLLLVNHRKVECDPPGESSPEHLDLSTEMTR